MRQYLRFIDFAEFPDRFRFYDYRVFNQEIESKSNAEFNSIVVNRNRLF